MKALFLLLTLLTLPGCAAISGLIDSAAEANDKLLETSEFGICIAASVGATQRKYNTPEKAKARNDLCRLRSKFTPIILDN